MERPAGVIGQRALPNRLSGMGVRDIAQRPLFRVVRQDSNQRLTGGARAPSWSTTPNGEIYFLGTGEVLTESRWNPPSYLRMMAQVVEGLACAQTLGLIHGGGLGTLWDYSSRFKHQTVTSPT